MQTWHIHINGLVQGVGFRPLINQLAEKMKIKGQVNNGNNGVHIFFNADTAKAKEFYQQIITAPPPNALLTSTLLEESIPQFFSHFSIAESNTEGEPDLLLTPDIAICPQCKQELFSPKNKRYHYPFITCLNCGPRYSIVTALPYDRENTSMKELAMCTACTKEFEDIHNRRHYSQTNTCPDCEIKMHLYNSAGNELCTDRTCILLMVDKALKDGHIVAVKGMGGYLLLADATNALTIETLRNRKQRPSKAFALLYPTLAMAEKDVWLHEKEKELLESKAAPIVLCTSKPSKGTGIQKELIAPGLQKLGIMLPYTPLLSLIAHQFNKPLIATSGNLSGSPIIYSDDEALCWLFDYADFILTFDREIVMPQDDSVLQVTPEAKQKIILRRSRGLAPNYYPNALQADEILLASGGELKSAFALLNYRKLFISQYLGDQSSFESQITYKNTVNHLLKLLWIKPQHILADKHPHYHVTRLAKEIASVYSIPVTEIQHHQAHFAAVLGENNLLATDEPLLGVIWDGAGYGNDGQIWGGEFFIYEKQQIDRVAWFDYFPQLLGDKMSKEPRLSAVSLLRNDMEQLMTIRSHFTVTEREYLLKLMHQPTNLLTSSVGRLLDGIASILNIQHYNTYEGEAALKLEALAYTSADKSLGHHPIPLIKNRLDWSKMTDAIISDKANNIARSRIAWKVFVSLAKAIQQMAFCFDTRKIAFSGGVFQNALLVDLIHQLMNENYELYFHQQLSPNDECIAYGQLAHYCYILNEPEQNYSTNKLITQN